MLSYLCSDYLCMHLASVSWPSVPFTEQKTADSARAFLRLSSICQSTKHSPITEQSLWMLFAKPAVGLAYYFTKIWVRHRCPWKETQSWVDNYSLRHATILGPDFKAFLPWLNFIMVNIFYKYFKWWSVIHQNFVCTTQQPCSSVWMYPDVSNPLPHLPQKWPQDYQLLSASSSVFKWLLYVIILTATAGLCLASMPVLMRELSIKLWSTNTVLWNGLNSKMSCFSTRFD